jgi:hypothetical protein
MRWQANACRTFSGGSAAGTCASRTGSTALGAGQRSANVSALASVAVQIAAMVRTARIAIAGVSYRLPGDKTVDLGVLRLFDNFDLDAVSVTVGERADCAMRRKARSEH